MYLQNEGVLRHETLQLFLFLFPLRHMKRPALQNKQAGVLRMTFRARKDFGTFEKRAPDDLKTPDSPFYLAINHTTKAINTNPWFKSAPMRVNKLMSLMKTMAEKAGLDAKHLTNHSGRKRMIQKLNDEDVPPTHIMQISGHKNVQSLNNYSTLLERQKTFLTF